MWPFVCAAAVAFTTSGTVSRYILPYEPLFVTIAVWVLLKYHEGNWRRSFNLWCATYVAAVVLILTICYLTTP